VPHTHSERASGAGGYSDEIPYQVKQRAGDRGITAENMKSHSIPKTTHGLDELVEKK